ncbi:endonuclease/exonuclease/phosphatase family protein [Candidatus Bathyarchaeota archaeon]|nr:endonuclease/exonuclease/phosphatase family protein [Candidatus Bathyarchaeota archaeon]
MATNRLLRRALSAFNHTSHRWVPIPPSNTQPQMTRTLPPTPPSLPPRSNGTTSTPKPTLSLVSWNIDAPSPRPIARAKLILSHILEAPKPPDIIFLQEVTPGVRDSLHGDARVRGTFLVTDAEDRASFKNVPFATITLLSSARFASGVDEQKEGGGIKERGRLTPGCVSRVALPSKYGRDALSVDIRTADTLLRLINVHLDSLGDTLHYRTQQMGILANILGEPGCGGGIIAGDFNVISPEDDALVGENGLVDAWAALHGTAANGGGATWGVDRKLPEGLAPGRLDKVAMLSVTAEEVEVLRPDFIEVPRPAKEPLSIPWSDHCGLRCTFTI